MKTHEFYFFVLGIVISLNSIGQDSTFLMNKADTLEKNTSGKHALTVAYFGETITHPGLNVGLEYVLWEKRKLKLISSVYLGGYTQRRHHKAIFLNVEGGLRRTASYGLYSDILIGFGYYHSWVNGDVYVRNGVDDVKVIRDKGNPHLLIDGSIGIGWDFTKNNSLPLNVFVRIKPLFIYPVNHNMLMEGALVLGGAWQF